MEARKVFRHICNNIYCSGIGPEDFLKTVMIPLEKKAGAIECSDFRTISLISHAGKVVLRSLGRRLQSRCEKYLGEEQFGFRKGRGTRDAIGVLRAACERYMERKKGVWICFVDLEKAFDRVSWTRLMSILKDKGIDWKERRLIKNLYEQQRVIVRVNGKSSDEIKIERGVRQGCCISPILFNLYVEDMMDEFQRECGLKIGGECINCIRFADDMALLSDDLEEMKGLVKKLDEVCDRYGMRINVKKTKIMSVGCEGETNVVIRNSRIEKVDSFKYLGSWVTADGRSEKDIRTRIGIAKVRFLKMKSILTSSLDLELRKRLCKCYVWSVFLYGSETWTIRKVDEKRIEAFEMWLWRRMMKIRWIDKVKNVDVLGLIGEERSLLKGIRKRKAKWIGHSLRGDSLLKKVFEGCIEGEKKRGRKRVKMCDDLKVGGCYWKMKRLAQDREKWREFDFGP